MNNISKNNKPAFTLVELLVVVVIIGILASLSMYALNGTVNAAKESKTRGTISKLNAAIMDIYEGYQDKFDNILTYSNYNSYTGTLTANELAELKQHLIYDMMRMEMPSYWSELFVVSGTPLIGTPSLPNPIPIPLGTGNFQLVEVPSVCQFYINEADRIKNLPNGNFNAGTAELLFLIIANLNPEALENFHGSEIGINENGCTVFLDAWGNPISFLRFAPGFTGADVPIQLDIVQLSRKTSTPIVPENYLTNWDTSWWVSTSTSVVNSLNILSQYADPFDEENVLKRSWILYPLIISAGADGKTDVYCSDNITPTDKDTLNPFNEPTGFPKDNDGNGVLNHHDNITNHRWSNSF